MDRDLEPERSPGVNLLPGSPPPGIPPGPPVATPASSQPLPTGPANPRPTSADYARRRIVVASVVAIALVAATVGATFLIYRDRPAREPAVAGSSLPTRSQKAAALVVVTTQSGEAASVLLLVGGGGEPTKGYVLPTELSLVVPGAGVVQLSSTTHLEGAELTSLAAANALGVRIDEAIQLGPGELAEMVGIETTFELALPWSFEGGGPVATGPNGGQLFTGVQLERMLNEQGPDNSRGFLERQRAVWLAFLAAPTRAKLGSGSELAQRLLSEPQSVTIEMVPVRETTLGSASLLSLDGARLDDFVETRLSGIGFGPQRPTVELLNGTGRAGASRKVAELLIRDGYHVVRVDNADRADYLTSQVVAMGREQLPTAERVLARLGKGEVKVQERGASSAVDVALVIGSDLAT